MTHVVQSTSCGSVVRSAAAAMSKRMLKTRGSVRLQAGSMLPTETSATPVNTWWRTEAGSYWSYRSIYTGIYGAFS